MVHACLLVWPKFTVRQHRHRWTNHYILSVIWLTVLLTKALPKIKRRHPRNTILTHGLPGWWLWQIWVWLPGTDNACVTLNWLHQGSRTGCKSLPVPQAFFKLALNDHMVGWSWIIKQTSVWNVKWIIVCRILIFLLRAFRNAVTMWS